MKTAAIPSLRVAPELRQAAEIVLQDGETLSGFVAQCLWANIERQRLCAPLLSGFATFNSSSV